MLCGIDLTIGERGTQEKHAQKTAWYTANTWTQNTTDTLQKGLLPCTGAFSPPNMVAQGGGSWGNLLQAWGGEQNVAPGPKKLWATLL